MRAPGARCHADGPCCEGFTPGASGCARLVAEGVWAVRVSRADASSALRHTRAVSVLGAPR